MEKLPESPFPEHNSEKAFPAKDSSRETFQQVSLIWIHRGRFQSHTLKSKELKQVSSTVGEEHRSSLQPAVAQHPQQNPASLRAQSDRHGEKSAAHCRHRAECRGAALGLHLPATHTPPQLSADLQRRAFTSRKLGKASST